MNAARGYNFNITKILNLKGIAIGLSDTSKEILKRLKKTEFINEIYIASSSKRTRGDAEIPLKKPKVLLQDKWGKLDLIIFIGSLLTSIPAEIIFSIKI